MLGPRTADELPRHALGTLTESLPTTCRPAVEDWLAALNDDRHRSSGFRRRLVNGAWPSLRHHNAANRRLRRGRRRLSGLLRRNGSRRCCRNGSLLNRSRLNSGNGRGYGLLDCGGRRLCSGLWLRRNGGRGLHRHRGLRRRRLGHRRNGFGRGWVGLFGRRRGNRRLDDDRGRRHHSYGWPRGSSGGFGHDGSCGWLAGNRPRWRWRHNGRRWPCGRRNDLAGLGPGRRCRWWSHGYGGGGLYFSLRCNRRHRSCRCMNLVRLSLFFLLLGQDGPRRVSWFGDM